MDYEPKKQQTNGLEPRPIVTDISVIIPTLGRPILEESLARIAAGTVWPGALIVVDQGAKAEVATLLQALQVAGITTRYVPSSQRGRAAGLNRGLEAATTRFVAVTDDDCFVEKDWLATMSSHLRQNQDTIVTGRVEAGSTEVLMTVPSRTSVTQSKPSLKFDRMSGGNMGTSMDVVARVGLFDEDPRVQTAEDAEWAYRALRAGVSILYAPDAGVCHLGWRDEAQRERQYESYARSHGGFYGKYLRRGDWFIALRAGLHHLRASRWWVRGLISHDKELVALGRAYVLGLIPGIISGMRRDVSR